jgi:hypothetical protein
LRGKVELIFTRDLKLAHFPIHSPLPIAALPSMSLIPSVPFTDNTDNTIEYPPKTPKDAKGSGLRVGQFLASFCVFGGPLWFTHIRPIRVICGSTAKRNRNEASEVF